MASLIPGTLVETLTAGVRLAIPYLTHLATSELSANAIIEQVRAAGLPVQRTGALAVIRAARNITNPKGYVASLRNDVAFNPERIPPSITNTLRKYSYVVRVNGTDMKNKEKSVQYITVSTSKPFPKQTAIDIAAGIVEGGTSSGGLIFEQGTVVSITQNPKL